MLDTHLRRGALAGAVGGAFYGLFTLFVVVPLVSFAESLDAGHHGAGSTEPAVSELTTAVISVGGGILWGILLGVLGFGMVYYFLEPAIPGPPRLKSYLLGAAGFITVSGAPWLVLPPLPPGVEQGLPTRTRVSWYLLMAVAGALSCGAAGYLYNTVRADWRRLRAAVAAGVPFLLLVGLAIVMPGTPTNTELPAQFIAAYQGVIGFSQATLWFGLASVHAWMTGRLEPASEDVATELSDPVNV